MSDAKDRWVNPAMLSWVRELLRVTPEQVAAWSEKIRDCGYVRVSARELKRWESGAAEPKLEHLETLALLYNCPVGYFFLDRPPQDMYTQRGLIKILNEKKKTERRSKKKQNTKKRRKIPRDQFPPPVSWDASRRIGDEFQTTR